jgi:hypothetical protein
MVWRSLSDPSALRMYRANLRAELPETLSDIGWGGRAGLSDLIAESAMPRQPRAFKKCSDLGAKFFRKLPCNGFFVVSETRHARRVASAEPVTVHSSQFTSS